MCPAWVHPNETLTAGGAEQLALQRAGRGAAELDRRVTERVAIGGRELGVDAHPRAVALGRQADRDPGLAGAGVHPRRARAPVLGVRDQGSLAAGPVLRGAAPGERLDAALRRLGRQPEVADRGLEPGPGPD